MKISCRIAYDRVLCRYRQARNLKNNPGFSRLVQMYSFAGDTVLDPFSGTGTTMVAAL